MRYPLIRRAAPVPGDKIIIFFNNTSRPSNVTYVSIERTAFARTRLVVEETNFYSLLT